MSNYICIAILVMSVHSACSQSFSINVNTKGSDSQLSDDPDTKTLTIKGIAKYKPGGDALLLSLLVKGEPGLMPGGSSSPTMGTSTSAQPTTSSAGSSPFPTTMPQGSSTTAGSSTGTFKDYEEEGLRIHNKFRAVHNAPPMKLNEEMNKAAQAYAEKIAKSGKMVHSQKNERDRQGENLAMGCSTNKGQTVTEAVTHWYNEVCDPGYNFNMGKHKSGTGHFTQVVWKDSVELGIGHAQRKRDGMLCTYTVGRYKPQGNFDQGNDDYRKNVKEGNFNRASYCSSVKKQFDQDKKMDDNKARIVSLAEVIKKNHLYHSQH